MALLNIPTQQALAFRVPPNLGPQGTAETGKKNNKILPKGQNFYPVYFPWNEIRLKIKIYIITWALV